MSRPIIYMAAFGLIALIAVTFAFLRGGPSLEPSGGNGRLPGLPVKPIGNTAISHGGPTPARAEGDSPPQAAAPIALGATVRFLRENKTSILTVLFVLFDRRALEAYERALGAAAESS